MKKTPAPRKRAVPVPVAARRALPCDMLMTINCYKVRGRIKHPAIVTSVDPIKPLHVNLTVIPDGNGPPQWHWSVPLFACLVDAEAYMAESKDPDAMACYWPENAVQH